MSDREACANCGKIKANDEDSRSHDELEDAAEYGLCPHQLGTGTCWCVNLCWSIMLDGECPHWLEPRVES